MGGGFTTLGWSFGAAFFGPSVLLRGGRGVIDPVKRAGKLRYTEGQQLAPDWSNKLGQEQN